MKLLLQFDYLKTLRLLIGHRDLITPTLRGLRYYEAPDVGRSRDSRGLREDLEGLFLWRTAGVLTFKVRSDVSTWPLLETDKTKDKYMSS